MIPPKQEAPPKQEGSPRVLPNAFENGTRKVIPAVLVYVRRGDHVLMIHRRSQNPQRVDDHQGKWNGLGGKCEADESPLQAAQRELREESGLEIPEAQFKALGVLQFPNFKPHKSEDWLVFVFWVGLESGFSQEVKTVTEEGELHWIPTKDLSRLNLWPGDRHFIDRVVEARPFVGTIWYKDQQVSAHWIQELQN